LLHVSHRRLHVEVDWQTEACRTNALHGVAEIQARPTAMEKMLTSEHPEL
jgi:hypothetical protein